MTKSRKAGTKMKEKSNQILSPLLLSLQSGPVKYG
jgi:hypothetical protein